MTCPAVIEVVTPGPPGPAGSGSTALTGPAVLGRAEATPGFAVALPLGTGLSIVNGTLTATGATNLSYDPATRLLSSSTGTDVTLPLADGANAGLLTAAEKLLIGTALQPGQAIPSDVECRNNSGVGLTAGAPVYIVSSSGTKPTVALADASSESTAARSLGLVVATVGNNADCMVRTHGVLTGVNTATLTEGAAVWLSETTGQLTSTRPTQPAHGVFFGFCIKQAAGTAGILYINVINGQELEELHDVLITGAPPAAGAPRPALVRGTDGLWRDLLLTPGDVGADSAGTASSAMSAHLAAADPHAQYTTPAEAAAAAPVQSVAGKTGAVTLVPSDVGAQPVDSDLTAIAALTTTTFGRGLLTTADAAAARTAIGAGTSSLATAGTATEIQYRNGTALGAIPGSVVDGATGAVQLTGLGAGVPPKPNYSIALGSGVLPRAQVVTAVGSTYTCDIRAASRFMLAAAIAGNTTIAFSNVADLAVAGGFVEYVEVEVDFSYTSGVITISASGFTTTWDGNTAATPTAGEIETLIVRITPAVTGTPFSTATVYVAPMRGTT